MNTGWCFSLVMSYPSDLLSTEWQGRQVAVTERTHWSVTAKRGSGDACLHGN